MIRNSLYNLIGMTLPIFVGLVSIPALIEVLGVEKFGMLTLIWAVVGYFGVFDLGLARSMTLVVREELCNVNGHQNVNSIIWTTSLALFSLGMLALFLVMLYVSFVGVSGELRAPLIILGITIPFVVVSNGIRGVLEAADEFAAINLIRTPLGVYTYLAPLFAAYTFESDLIAITILLGFGRISILFLYTLIALRKIPALKINPCFRFSHLPRLLKFGGWLTVSNLVSPLMGYLDRFFIAKTLGLDSVAFYVTPYDIITRLWIIPGAVTGVLFPRLIGLRSNNDFGRIYRDLIISTFSIFIIVAPVACFIYIYSWELISWWINEDFADKSSDVIKVLSIGIVINCVTHIPYTLIQSTGNSKVTAIIHLIELPVLLISLIPLIEVFGILGAAYAWLMRVTLDFLLIWYTGIGVLRSQRK